jgi:uncharacterized repeat protein (TIGR03803 family)
MKRSTFISLTTLLAGFHISVWASNNTINNNLLAKLKGSYQYTILHDFSGPDGKMPYSGLIYNESYGIGNYFYGTTTQGGAYNAGTVFSISADGQNKSIIYTFQGGNDGANPYAALTDCGNANAFILCGTTQTGGSRNLGTVYSIDIRAGKKLTLYSFQGGTNDGANPVGKLVRGSDGNLYGTTLGGGRTNNGTIYRITLSGDEEVLHSFQGGNDGATPYAGLTSINGLLYGTTEYGGSSTNCGSKGCGTIFYVDALHYGIESVAYSFQGGTNDGANPLASLLYYGSRYAYGTTLNGGSANNGTVFSLDLNNDRVNTVYSFKNTTGDGAHPYAGVILGIDNGLYGTTAYGGAYGHGSIYSIFGSTEVLLYSFGGPDGSNPAGTLFQGPNAALYGTTVVGGSANFGTVFKIESSI